MFLDTLARHYRDRPDKTAIEFLGDCGTRQLSYAQLEGHVKRAATYLLSLGVKRGDRVAVQLPKSLPFIYFHLADHAGRRHIFCRSIRLIPKPNCAIFWRMRAPASSSPMPKTRR